MNLNGLQKLLEQRENQRVEFKEAKLEYSLEKLSKYCCALANEGGGQFVLGVNDAKEVLGTRAFLNLEKTCKHLFDRLKIRVIAHEIEYGDNRVLVFDIPSRNVAQTVSFEGRRWMRVGESLEEMDDQTLRKILSEVSADFTATFVDGLTQDELDPLAMNELKRLWAMKSERADFKIKSDEEVLKNLSLMSGNKITYAGLILLGKSESIQKYLPDSEIIFEWRQIPGKIEHDYRKNWRAPFLLIYNEIWEDLNKRNIRTPFQEGFIQREVFAFQEGSIREALLNAVIHRNYSLQGASIMIKASPEQLSIESPGGFMPGINVDNILSSQKWRNRLLAETLEKTGLVERAGQGMNDIYQSCIEEGKGTPSFEGTDDYRVVLNIPAKVTDPNFILYLEKIANEKQISFAFDEIFELEKIRSNQKLDLLKFKDKFLNLGIIENIGKGRGSKYILSHHYYTHKGKPGVYTRLVGLSREKSKELILGHIRKNTRGYMKDFADTFPELERQDISNLLYELKNDGKIHFEGSKKNGFWQLDRN
jgi:ATP-dependent DNA helicase RecG